MLGQLVLISQVFLCTLLEGSNLQNIQKNTEDLLLPQAQSSEPWLRISSIPRPPPPSDSSEESLTISTGNGSESTKEAPQIPVDFKSQVLNMDEGGRSLKSTGPEVRRMETQLQGPIIITPEPNLKPSGIENTTTFNSQAYQYHSVPNSTNTLLQEPFQKDSRAEEFNTTPDYSDYNPQDRGDPLFSNRMGVFEGFHPESNSVEESDEDELSQVSSQIQPWFFQPPSNGTNSFNIGLRTDESPNPSSIFEYPGIYVSPQPNPTPFDDAMSGENSSILTQILPTLGASTLRLLLPTPPSSLTESQELELAKNRMMAKTFGNLMSGLKNQFQKASATMKKMMGGVRDMFNMMCQIMRTMMRDVSNFVKYMFNMDKSIMGLMQSMFGGGMVGGDIPIRNNVPPNANPDWLIPLFDLNTMKDNASAGGYASVTTQPYAVDGGNKDKDQAGSGGNDILAQKAATKAKIVAQKTRIKAQKTGGAAAGGGGGGTAADKQEAGQGSGWEDENSGQWAQEDSGGASPTEWAEDGGDLSINEWNDELSTASSEYYSGKKGKKKRRRRPGKSGKKSKKKNRRRRTKKKKGNYEYMNINSGQSQLEHPKDVEYTEEKAVVVTKKPKIHRKKKNGGNNKRPSLSWDFYTFRK